MKNSAKCPSKDTSGKKWIFIKRKATCVLGPRPNKKTNTYKKKSIKIDIRQAETSIGNQASEGGVDSEEGEWASEGVPDSSE